MDKKDILVEVLKQVYALPPEEQIAYLANEVVELTLTTQMLSKGITDITTTLGKLVTVVEELKSSQLDLQYRVREVEFSTARCR